MNTEGRTLVVMKDQNISEYVFENLKNKFVSSTGTTFLEFENIESCKKIYDKFEENDIKCKYSQYKIFLRFKTKLNDINEIKKLITDKLTELNDELNIVNLTLFEKNSKFIECGYLILDRIEDFNKLLGINKVELNSEELLLFKFNKK